MVKNKKKILSAVSFVLSLVIFALALGVFIVTLNARSKNRPAVLFGFSFAVVVTGSMSPEINIGDMIIVKSCDITEMQEGQNAVFIGTEGEYKDKSIVHRVIKVVQPSEENGWEVQLITQGLTNTEPDPPVTASYFIGREVFHSAALGAIMVFLQTPMNWLYMLVIAVAVGVIVTQLIKIIKHFKNKEPEETKEE